MNTQIHTTKSREQTGHTPGPWYQYNTSSGKRDPHSHMVCTDSLPRRIFGERKQFSQPAIVVQTTMCTSVDGEEATANARLIAAAPQLLEAAKAAVEFINENHSLLANRKADSMDCQLRVAIELAAKGEKSL